MQGNNRTLTRSSRLIGPLLALIVSAGAVLRFSHADWDGGNQLHPDERAILFVAQDIAPPHSLGEAFSAQSPLNPLRTHDGQPRYFVYGHFPLYASAGAAYLFQGACQLLSEMCQRLSPDSFAGRLLNSSGESVFTHLTYVGRALSALADTMTILAAFGLAWELWGARAGLLTAGFMALAVLHIQNAHFGTVDSGLGLFCTAAVWLCVRYARSHSQRASILAGICAGLAMAHKMIAVVLIIPMLTAHLAVRTQDRPGASLPRLAISQPRVIGLTLIGWISAFVLSSPYAILDPLPTLTSLAGQAQLMAGGADWPFVQAQAVTLPVWYIVEQQARWTLGLPLTLVAYAGLVWAGYHAVRERSRQLTVTLAWALVMLIVVGFAPVRFPRYAIPVTPTLLACGAGMLVSIGRSPETKYQRVVPRMAWVVAVLVCVTTAFYALAFDQMYRSPHPWVQASQWAYDDIPSGQRIAVERWDDPLPLDLTVGETLYVAERFFTLTVIDTYQRPDDSEKLRAMLETLQNSDYLILASSRLYRTILTNRDRYPLATAYYTALFSGDLGFELVQVFQRVPALAGLCFVEDPLFSTPITGLTPIAPDACGVTISGPADESITAYDHPLVLVFQNRARYSAEMMVAIITSQTLSNRR